MRTSNMIKGSTLFLGDSTTNLVANATVIQVSDTAGVGGLKPTLMNVGNSTVNSTVNSIALNLSNSTVNYSLIKPTAAQVSSADYYPASDGVWKQVSGGPGGTPGGANTEIQFNDSTAFGANNLFTFNKDTSTMGIGANVVVNATCIAIVGNTTTAPSLVISSNSTVDIVFGNNTITGAPSIAMTNSISNALYSSISTTFGNSTVNALSNSITLYITNSTANAILTPATFTINTVSATTNGFSATAALLQIGNTSISANHTPTGFIVGTSTTNSTTYASGANVVLRTTEILVGNSIVNTIVGNTQIAIGNSTVNATVNSIAMKINSNTIANCTVTPTNFFPTKSISVLNPTSGDDLTFTWTQVPLTVAEIRSVVKGSVSPSVTVSIYSSTDRTGASNTLHISANVTTNVTTGNTWTSFGSATVAANSWVWATLTTVSGTITEYHCTMRFA